MVADRNSLRRKDRASDSVNGLVELPEKRLKPCNQALVFMVKGVSIK